MDLFYEYYGLYCSESKMEPALGRAVGVAADRHTEEKEETQAFLLSAAAAGMGK